jgi:hypothetical protein
MTAEAILRKTLRSDRLTWRPYVVTVAGSVRDEIDFTAESDHVVCRRRVTNDSRQTIQLVELGIRLEGISFGGDPADDYFYHTENPRIYQRMAIPVRLKRTAELVKDSGFDTLAGNRWADPGVVSERVGASPYQPFPAVLLSNYRTNVGLVHGSLSQRVFFHNHLFGPGTWDILSSIKAVAHRQLRPGETLEDLWYLGRTGHADDIERLFEPYLKVLRQHLPPLRGAGKANRHSVVWGSWNDGVFRDIDQERLLQMAEFIRDHLPTVQWLQIDDGYAARAEELKLAHGLGVPYEGEDGVDRRKFPQGLRAYTDAVRERGLHPALWVGGFVPAAAPLARDHPDWFVDYSYRVTTQRVLDVSQPEVREYMLRALEAFTTHGGFEGIKLDFWSYAFEDSHPLLAGCEGSGYEWRSWWLGEMCKRLPEHGYLQTGCDIAMGNPFLAEWFTNYRYGIDVGGGDWEHFVTNFLWGAACVATHTGDLFAPNSDAIGLLPGLSEDEALTAINYCLVSGSLVEVAGWLYQQPDHPRLRWVKKAICCPNNGRPVHFADYDYRDPASLGPPIWFSNTPHFSRLEGHERLPRRTVAVFNLTDEPRTFTLTPGKLRLPAGRYVATNVWSLTSEDLGDVTLAPRSSRLLAISPKTDWLQILDANIRVEDVQVGGDTLAIRFAHAGDLELLTNRGLTRTKLTGTTLTVT